MPKKFAVLATIGILLPLSGLVPSGAEGVAFSQPANLYTFSGDVEITEAPPDDGSSYDFYSSGQHYTAFRGDTVYVVWAESRASTPPTGNHIFFAKSTDRGQTFGPNVRVNSTAAGFNPSMRVDTSGIIYVAYERQGNIFFTKSTDGGNTFTPAVQVVDSAGLPYFQELPSIAVNNKGHVFVAWIDYRINIDTASVFVSASYDGGQTFGANANVDSTQRDRRSSDISCDNEGHVYVVYAELLPNVRQTALARSSDSGQAFDFHTYVSDVPSDGSSCCAIDPSIAVGHLGKVGVAWQDVRFNQSTLRFSVSADFGQTFSSSVRVDDDSDLTGPGSPQFPSLVWNRNVFWLVWREIRFDPSISDYVDHIFFSYSPNNGLTFAKNVSVFDSSSGFVAVVEPSLCVNENGQAFAAWLDDRYDPFFGERWHIFGAAGSPIVVKGDLNLDSLLSPVDVVMELNAVFLGQPFPAPFEAADGNCDGRLTPADVALHLNAIFLGRVFPC